MSAYKIADIVNKVLASRQKVLTQYPKSFEGEIARAIYPVIRRWVVIAYIAGILTTLVGTHVTKIIPLIYGTRSFEPEPEGTRPPRQQPRYYVLPRPGLGDEEVHREVWVNQWFRVFGDSTVDRSIGDSLAELQISRESHLCYRPADLASVTVQSLSGGLRPIAELGELAPGNRVQAVGGME